MAETTGYVQILPFPVAESHLHVSDSDVLFYLPYRQDSDWKAKLNTPAPDLRPKTEVCARNDVRKFGCEELSLTLTLIVSNALGCHCYKWTFV